MYVINPGTFAYECVKEVLPDGFECSFTKKQVFLEKAGLYDRHSLKEFHIYTPSLNLLPASAFCATGLTLPMENLRSVSYLELLDTYLCRECVGVLEKQLEFTDWVQLIRFFAQSKKPFFNNSSAKCSAPQYMQKANELVDNYNALASAIGVVSKWDECYLTSDVARAEFLRQLLYLRSSAYFSDFEEDACILKYLFSSFFPLKILTSIAFTNSEVDSFFRLWVKTPAVLFKNGSIPDVFKDQVYNLIKESNDNSLLAEEELSVVKHSLIYLKELLDSWEEDFSYFCKDFYTKSVVLASKSHLRINSLAMDVCAFFPEKSALLDSWLVFTVPAVYLSNLQLVESSWYLLGESLPGDSVEVLQVALSFVSNSFSPNALEKARLSLKEK